MEAYFLVSVTARDGDAELEAEMKEAIIDTLTNFNGSGAVVSVSIGT